MTRLRPDLRLSWVALAAVLGLVSAVGEASAAGNGRSCCTKPVCPMGCCGQPDAQSGTETAVPPAAVVPVRVRLTSPAPAPCECRSDEPAEPAPKPEAPTSDWRPDQDHAGSVDLPLASSRPAASAPVGSPTFALSRAPLLLDTTRLRF
jgi:hypothetical protein